MGDGTAGWPEAAPFDAILVAAGGPSVPPALKRAARNRRTPRHPGRGRQARSRNCSKITRARRERIRRGGSRRRHVRAADRRTRLDRGRSTEAGGVSGTIADLAGGDRRLRPRPCATSMIRRSQACSTVSPTGASCCSARRAIGASEFYRARAAITRRVIERHGFTIVAVETDSPVGGGRRYVRHRPARSGAEAPFRRFPTWMSRDTDVVAFIEWMHAHNATVAEGERRAGFYGRRIRLVR